jgi:two-component system, NarL family, response regulator DegU
VSDRIHAPIRVFVIDSHTIFRAGLRLLLKSEPEIQLVGEAWNRASGLELISSTPIDVVLLELELGRESGLDLIPELLSIVKQAQVLILTGLDDLEKQARAVQMGARGLVHKQDEVGDLLNAIRKVYLQEVWFNPRLSEKLLRRISQGAENGLRTNSEKAKIAALTKRELEIIPLVCEGLRNQMVADRLFMSEGTLRNHLTSIYGKLGVTDRFELIIYAYRNRLAEPPHQE